MKPRPRKAAFVLVPTDQGSFIVNRFDYCRIDAQTTIGVGHHLLESSCYEPDEIGVGVAMLEIAKILRGDGVVAVDCGANIGVNAVEWARAMTGWGRLLAFEAQERVFYALAGNLALNNCFNASARHAAVGASCGKLAVPVPDYLQPGSFGSLELRQSAGNEFIGQKIDYAPAAMAEIECLSLDSLELPRLDFLKIDVEAMELEVLEGARATIRRSRPLMMVEAIKSDALKLQAWLEGESYHLFRMGPNLVAVHESDPARAHIRPAGA